MTAQPTRPGGGDLHSAIYEGRVRHRRHRPRPHHFSYPLFMMYLDLDELPHLFDGRWLWSSRGPAPAWFRRQDFLGPVEIPLDESVRRRVESSVGRRPEGPIRMLTHLRYWGYQINPVTFYYCFRDDPAPAAGGVRHPSMAPPAENAVQAIVAEITNTPWGERHSYVLSVDHQASADGQGAVNETSFRLPKEFHVSPFMPMQLDYLWRFGTPGRRLWVQMQNLRRGDRIFDATLTLERRPIQGPALARALCRHPWMSGRIAFGIYYQALRLWLKKTPFHSHPKHSREVSTVPPSGEAS